MLVLSRKVGERIVIGNDVIVEVLEICHGKVRLGTIAPQTVSVHRQEVWNALHGGKHEDGVEARDPAKRGPGRTA